MKSDTSRPLRGGLENVIVRIPTAIRQQLVDLAEKASISQNQLINGYLFTALFVLRFEPKCGPPANVEHFIAIVESALAREDGLAFGAFNRDDWDSIAPCVEAFVDGALITPPQTRTDPQMPTTVAFTFLLTKFGRTQLPLIIRMIKPTLAGISDGQGVSNRIAMPV